MKVIEYCFSDYYHQYMTIEADALTDICKDHIRVEEEDCYAVCSAFVAEDGLAMFRILSIGPSWEDCTRGLDQADVLGVLGMDEIAECEARLVDADYDMIQKNQKYLDYDAENADDDLEEIRKDRRLDDLRDPLYPDHIVVGIISRQAIYEYTMCVDGIKGPFLYGTLDEEPETEIGVHMDDLIYALPYTANSVFHMFALFAGSEMNDEQQEAIDKIVAETSKIGMDFEGISIKN